MMDNREHFEFSREIFKNFEEYLFSYGFNCVSSNATFVRFESRSVFVNFFHGRSSYEIGAEIGLIIDPENAYPISWFIEIRDEDKGKNYRNTTASTYYLVKESILRLRNIFEQYATPALNGKVEIFKSIEQKVKSWQKSYAMDVKASQTRPKAEEAFRTKKYKEAMMLYKSLESVLTPVEKEKLSYCRAIIEKSSS